MVNIISAMRAEIKRARELRRNMSQPEVILWSRLKPLRGRGYAFRRQYPLRGYFLDFVCLSYRLVVEVDGCQHTEDRQAEYDAVRDRVLQRQGFRVVRVTTGDVRYHLDDVMDHIITILEATPRVHGSGPPETPRLDHTASP